MTGAIVRCAAAPFSTPFHACCICVSGHEDYAATAPLKYASVLSRNEDFTKISFLEQFEVKISEEKGGDFSENPLPFRMPH